MGNILTFAYIKNKAKYSNKYTDLGKSKKYYFNANNVKKNYTKRQKKYYSNIK